MKEFTRYTQGKAPVHFPLDKPILSDLIKRIVAFCVEETAMKAAKK